MKRSLVALPLAAAAVLASLGTGCAVAQDPEHDHEHRTATTGSSEKGAKPAADSSGAQPDEPAAGERMMDMKAMCDMHRHMMSAGSPTEREAMAGKEMKGMSAERKRQHMKRMDEQCK